MNSKIKVMYLIDGYGGGAVTHILNLALCTPKDRFSSLIVFYSNGPSVKLAKKLGLKVFIIKKYTYEYILCLLINGPKTSIKKSA